jgi:hypothetical protein
MNEISIKEDRTCIPLSRIKEETNLPDNQLRKIINEAIKVGKVINCNEIGLNERGYTLINEQKNLDVDRKEILIPTEITKDYIIVENTTRFKVINMSLDCIRYIHINFSGDIVWDKKFYYKDSTGNKIVKILKKDECPKNNCSFSMPVAKPILPRQLYSFSYTTYYYLFPEYDYFVFNINAPTINFSIKILSNILDVVDIKCSGNLNNCLLNTKRVNKWMEFKTKHISPPSTTTLKIHIKNI